jgi:hypothetical protein
MTVELAFGSVAAEHIESGALIASMAPLIDDLAAHAAGVRKCPILLSSDQISGGLFVHQAEKRATAANFSSGL